MKILVIGATHAGTFATQQILTEHPDYDVTVYERNHNLSFLSCGIALWVGDHVSDPEKMFYSSPEALAALGANMQMEHDGLAIDPVAKTVEVKDLKTGNVTTDTYDKLVYTTGSTPIVPNIPGIHDTDVHLCKNWHDAKALKALAPTIKSAIVIGAGYIGAELAEQYALTDKQVTLIDGLPRVLAKNFDATITDRVEKLYTDHGVNLALGEMVTGFDQGTDGEMTVTTDKGSYTADIAVLCTGFRPNTELLKDHLETLPNGAVITDAYMQTSDPAIFAAGDTATVHYNPTGKNDYIPLATNAVRQGILVGKNIEKPTEKYLGTQSSSAVELFEHAIAASGMTTEGAKARGIEVASVTLEQDYRPDFMLTTTPVLCSLTWDPKTHEVKGGAFFSKHDISQSANVISLAIQTHMTIETLAMVDMLFQPNFDQPINWVNAVAMAAVAKAQEMEKTPVA
ncbi:FAD-dependent oxidoreductase [Lacticaseibacillus paracasei]|uniref:FAD-dependent oxidoreductase n=1 Tax=Lacticaseibacillus paracasei TaxID=1597 RepID=UPI000F0BA25A|nr:FAD-dependent oxidoreductase [Lacticaseibacillus paracasei]RND56064.1 NADH oxidase [Lacticaseibacillus paracasei]